MSPSENLGLFCNVFYLLQMGVKLVLWAGPRSQVKSLDAVLDVARKDLEMAKKMGIFLPESEQALKE